MAEALLRDALEQVGYDCRVSSAGIGALVGHKADKFVQQLLMARNLDVSQHVARQLDSELVRSADLILVMEQSHKTAIETNHPAAKGKVFRLAEWEKLDIPDPYRKELQVFEDVLRLIESGVDSWLKKLGVISSA